MYFGYYYRAYLGNSIRRSILPVIFINLFIGFMVSGIDNAARIGGLVGGIVTSMAFGFTNRSEKTDKINGIIITLLVLLFFELFNK